MLFSQPCSHNWAFLLLCYVTIKVLYSYAVCTAMQCHNRAVSYPCMSQLSCSTAVLFLQLCDVTIELLAQNKVSFLIAPKIGDSCWCWLTSVTFCWHSMVMRMGLWSNPTHLAPAQLLCSSYLPRGTRGSQVSPLRSRISHACGWGLRDFIYSGRGPSSVDLSSHTWTQKGPSM